MKKTLIVLVILALVAAAGIYLFGNFEDLQGRFGKAKNSMESEETREVKPSNGMESEETREFKQTNGMEAEETRE